MKSFLGFLFLLSPLIIVVIWAILTWTGIRYGRQYLKNAGSQRKRRIALFILLGAIWFGASFWYSGGRKFYYDAVVLSLCAKDGGVKVYERVELPAERFDPYGVMRIPSKSDKKPGDEYHYETNIYYYQEGSPEIWRLHFQIFKSANNKLLGEAISYARRGGDITGPWHESSFGCPEQSDISDLKKMIFSKMDLGVQHESD